LITFLDEALRVKEERDYLSRIDTHPESYSKNKFDEKLHGFGTLTIIYKINEKNKKINSKTSENKKKKIEVSIEQRVYQSYKQLTK